MKVICPDCGKVVEVPTGHPPKLNIPVMTLCDTLAQSKDVLSAADSLGCSRAYIYRELKAVGKTPNEFINRKG